jgi:hypothetical protein
MELGFWSPSGTPKDPHATAGGQFFGPIRGHPKGDRRYHVALERRKIYDDPGGVTPEEYMSQVKYRDAIDFGGM